MNDSRSDRPRFAGATRDLADRKIFPALEAMLERGRLDVPVIGAAQGVWSLVTRKCLFLLPWLNHFSRRQGVEDDPMNVICMGVRTAYAQRDIPEAFLRAGFRKAPRQVRRFAKVVSLEPEITRSKS
jgi:glucose-6-phosphate 1-dehydrogenase